MQPNYIDIIITVPLIWGIYKGFNKGLIFEAASIVALGIGVWAGTNFSDLCSTKIVEWTAWQSPYLPIASFAIVFIGVVALVHLSARVLNKLAKGLALGGLDKILGAVLGSLKYALIISVLIYIISAVEKSYPLANFDAKNESVLYEPIGKIAPVLLPALGGSNLIP